ncbi:MAG: aldo/keto reductase [Victivallaceae bacterium]|nr:aldo/keto reductase [Victivallaceae bacterium]
MMKHKILKNGFSIPALGMGTWQFGGRETHDPANDDDAQIAALRAGIESGFSLIDTAEYYADGYAEILVGKAIANLPREQLFLTDKVWKTHLTKQDLPRAAEASIQRMNCEYLDLYLYHQVSDEVPLEESIEAMNLLVRRGLVRHIGVSNFAPARLARAMAASEAPIVVNQVHYSLAVREAEKTLLDFCQQHDVILQAWRPLRGVESCEEAEQLCKKYHTSLQVLALAYLLNQNQVAAIAAMSSAAHIRENRTAVDLQLDAEDLLWLRNCWPDQLAFGRVPLR